MNAVRNFGTIYRQYRNQNLCFYEEKQMYISIFLFENYFNILATSYEMLAPYM